MGRRKGLGRRSSLGQGGQWNEPVGTQKECASWGEALLLLLLLVLVVAVKMVVIVAVVVMVMVIVLVVVAMGVLGFCSVWVWGVS